MSFSNMIFATFISCLGMALIAVALPSTLPDSDRAAAPRQPRSMPTSDYNQGGGAPRSLLSERAKEEDVVAKVNIKPEQNTTIMDGYYGPGESLPDQIHGPSIMIFAWSEAHFKGDRDSKGLDHSTREFEWLIHEPGTMDNPMYYLNVIAVWKLILTLSAT